MKLKIVFPIVVGLVILVFVSPIIAYDLGWRPPDTCCVRDHGVVYQVIQFATFRSVRWDVYYNANNTGYNGDVVVRCDYYKVGMPIEVVRNIQKPLPFAGTPINPVANGTDFKTVVGPSGC